MAPCPSCSREVSEQFAFCPFCGAATAPTSAATEERKLVTLLFADVSGSTKLSEELDAEIVRELMASYFDLAREEIEARGGTVEKFIGDAVMAVFGVPVAHEDDPARALTAALAIRRRLGELNERLTAQGQPELQVRIGINSGDVVSTLSPRPGEVMVTGDAVNVAARIQQMAEPGQVLVGGRTALAAPSFGFRPVGARQVRGKTTEIEVSELVAEPAVSSGRAAVLRAPLVGRDQELALMSSIFDRVAADRRPHLITLYGQPGVGKSRLTYEFLARLEGHPSRPDVVRGRCLSYGSGVTFWPLAEILKGRAEILDSDPPEGAQRKLESLGRSLLTGVSSDPSRATALLGYTVGIALPGHDFSHLDPEVLRGEILEAWRSFFSALATSRPIVAVIEDIHWADEALLDMLDDLGARVEGPVLFVCPARPDLNDRRPSWGGGRRSFSAMYLDPLEPEDTSRLISLLLEIEDLPADLHRRIVERAGGNPFFAEEILRHLIDQGGISRSAGAWQAEQGLTAVAIPDTVQAVLAARIDLLGADEKRALQAAAVVGRSFWPAPICRYLEAPAGRVAELLRGLEARDFVITRLGSTMAGQTELIFKHALVRDVAYESIPKRDRAVAHLQIARWIEETVGERRLEVVELLAHHYTEAQRAAAWGRVEPDRREEIRSRAVDLLFEAAEESARLFAMDRAKKRLATGLELARGPVERARGLETHAHVAVWDDDGDEAWSASREAVDLHMSVPAGRVDRRAVARLCGFMLAMPTRWPGLMRNLPSRADAQRYLDLGLSMLDEGDGEERLGLLMARASWGWGFAEADLDPDRNAEYIVIAEEAVALARRLGSPALLSGALDTAGAAVGSTGGYRASLAYQEKRLALIPQLDDPAEVTDIVGTMAWALVHIGEYRRAADLSAESHSSRVKVLPLMWHAVKGAMDAVAYFRLGEWDRVWPILAEAEATTDQQRPVRYHTMRLYGTGAYLREVSGDAAEADRLIRRVDDSQATRGDVGVSGARLWIVLVLLRRGAFAEARRRLSIADPVRESQNRDYTLEAWAELIAEEGRWDEAPSIVAEAREWAAKTGLKALPAFADKLEGRAAIAAGDRERGLELLHSARRALDGLDAVWDRSRIDLILAETFLANERWSDAAEAARAALASIQHLEAPREIAGAREIIAAASA